MNQTHDAAIAEEVQRQDARLAAVKIRTGKALKWGWGLLLGGFAAGFVIPVLGILAYVGGIFAGIGIGIYVWAQGNPGGGVPLALVAVFGGSTVGFLVMAVQMFYLTVLGMSVR